MKRYIRKFIILSSAIGLISVSTYSQNWYCEMGYGSCDIGAQLTQVASVADSYVDSYIQPDYTTEFIESGGSGGAVAGGLGIAALITGLLTQNPHAVQENVQEQEENEGLWCGHAMMNELYHDVEIPISVSTTACSESYSVVHMYVKQYCYPYSENLKYEAAQRICRTVIIFVPGAPQFMFLYLHIY